ncbi:LuxR C-terminal-related transcriptional regulator [Arthrobacter sp. NPDC092385]|uniref:helix-turn-helix transcriptional regulator n=1 Tax=Arthrobacter sp. NPDC092385 TaxID=3363943 RepID=UPI00380B5718
MGKQLDTGAEVGPAQPGPTRRASTGPLLERVPPGAWPLVGRTAEIDRVKAALLHAGSSGALVVGAAGQGKTTVARNAVNTLPERSEILYIRGSSVGAGMPYGALTVLLVDVDEHAAHNPLLLFTALQAMFGRLPGGRPIVVVDNVEDLDPHSATVLAHLASARSVRVVVLTEQVRRTPEPFLELWRNQLLERIDIEPLTLEHTRELAEEVLGNPVSRVLAVELWRGSNGKAGALRTMIPLALESGWLELREGVWTQPRFPGEEGIAEARAGSDLLDALSGHARTAVALLGVLGAMPLRMLLCHVPGEEVDRLQQDRVVRVLRHDAPTAVLDDPFAGAVLRAALARAPEAAIDGALREIERGELPPDTDVRLTTWLMQAGSPVTDARLLRSARHANHLALPHLARRFLSGVDAWEEHPDAVLQYARVTLDGAEAEEARSAIAALLQQPGLPPAVRAALRLEGARMRIRHAHHPDVVMEELRACEAECAAVEGRDAAYVTRELALLGLELALLQGRCADVVERASVLLTSIVDYSSPAIRVRGMLVLALASTGQYERADLVAEALARCPHTSSSPSSHPSDREEARRSVVMSLVSSGRLDEALELLHAGSGLPGQVQDEAWSESMEGMLLAGAGRSREALAALLPAIAQLRAEDRSGMLPAIEAAAAYAYALNGQDDAARDYLDRARHTGERPDRVSLSTSDYFSTLTVSLLEDPAAAARQMLHSADRERGLGNTGLELVFLTQAVRLGEYASAHRLSVRAGGLRTPLAQCSLLLGKGILAQDAALLLEAAEAGLAIGHHDLAGSSALLAVDLRAPEDDPLIFVRAEQILRQTSVERRRSRTRQSLTDRERAVARMVARGASNRDIAAAEHVSVRTAEGYVHRAMAKLGVHNRKQLRSVFAKQ